MKRVWTSKEMEVLGIFDENELHPVRDVWDRMATHPSVDPDIYWIHVRKDPRWISPACLVAKRGSEIVGMLIGCVQAKCFDFRVGYTPVAKVRGKVLAVLDRGVIGSDDPKLAEAFLRAVRELLREGVADFTHFSSVPLNSPVRPAAQAIFPWYMREGNNIIEPRWYLNIPANFNEFIASRSKNTRANLRRNEKARQASGIGFRVELYTGDGGALVRAYDTVQEVARCTYQYRLGLSPLCEPLSREVWESLSTVGKVAAVVVFAEGQPISFAYAQLYKSTAKFGTPGYKPNFGPLRVGEYAILRLIETLIDCEIRVLDYGLGYSQYKETLGTDFRMEGHVRVFAGSARGLFIRLLRTTTVCASRFLLAGAERLKVKRLIKKLVRSHS